MQKKMLVNIRVSASMLAPLISVDNKQGDDEAILYMDLNINNAKL